MTSPADPASLRVVPSRKSAAVEGFPPGADPDGYRTQFAATRRLRTFPERFLFRAGDRPITCRELLNMWFWGVSEAGWLKPLLHLLHTVFTWTAPRLHRCRFTVVAG